MTNTAEAHEEGQAFDPVESGDWDVQQSDVQVHKIMLCGAKTTSETSFQATCT
jgi:hypothetical protein